MQQIVNGLSKVLNCPCLMSDVNSFLEIFDKDGDGFLKYTEFCDAFLPLDNEQAAKLASKPPQYEEEDVDWSRQLPADLKVEFANVWKTHFKICKSLH